MKVERPLYLIDALWRLAEAGMAGPDPWLRNTAHVIFRKVLTEWGNPKRSNREIEEQVLLGLITLSPAVLVAGLLFPDREPGKFALALPAPAGYTTANPSRCTKCDQLVVGELRSKQASIVIVCIACLKAVGIEFNLTDAPAEPTA